MSQIHLHQSSQLDNLSLYDGVYKNSELTISLAQALSASLNKRRRIYTQRGYIYTSALGPDTGTGACLQYTLAQLSDHEYNTYIARIHKAHFDKKNKTQKKSENSSLSNRSILTMNPNLIVEFL